MDTIIKFEISSKGTAMSAIRMPILSASDYTLTAQTEAISTLLFNSSSESATWKDTWKIFMTMYDEMVQRGLNTSKIDAQLM